MLGSATFRDRPHGAKDLMRVIAATGLQCDGLQREGVPLAVARRVTLGTPTLWLSQWIRTMVCSGLDR